MLFVIKEMQLREHREPGVIRHGFYATLNSVREVVRAN